MGQVKTTAVNLQNDDVLISFPPAADGVLCSEPDGQNSLDFLSWSRTFLFFLKKEEASKPTAKSLLSLCLRKRQSNNNKI